MVVEILAEAELAPTFDMLKVFYIRHKDYLGEDTKPIEAYDHEHAAENYAEEFDIGDYTLLNGETEIIEVEGPDGSRRTFRISGETIPHYTAREITEKESNG